MLLISALIPPIRNQKSKTPIQLNEKSRPLARVERVILPGEDGQVYFEGVYWRARFYDPTCQVTADVGDKVEVINDHQLPLMVMPLNFDRQSSSNS